MRKNIFTLALVVVLALLVAVPAIGCAPEEVAPPVEEKVIKVGSIIDLTGPYSTIGVPIGAGGMDFWKYLNEDLGGISGIKVDHLWTDSKGSPAFCITQYKRFKEQGALAFTVSTSTENVAIQSFYNNDKIPAIGSSTSFAAICPEGAGMYYNAYCGSMARLLAVGLDWWYKNEWPKQGLDRPMRVGMVTWDNALGRDGADGAKRWIDMTSGAELVQESVAGAMTMDYTTNLLVIKGKNPDIIVNSTSGGAYGLVARDAVRVGLEVPILMEATGISLGNVALAGEGYRLVFTPCCYYSIHEDVPGVKLFKEVNMRYRKGKYWGGYDYFMGWRDHGIVLSEAIRIAMDKVGYENLTGMAVKEGFDSIKNFDPGVGSPVTFGEYPGDRTGQDMFRIWRWDVDAGKEIIATDWFKGLSHKDLGFDESPGYGLSQ